MRYCWILPSKSHTYYISSLGEFGFLCCTKYFIQWNPQFLLPNASFCMRYVRRIEILINCFVLKGLKICSWTLWRTILHEIILSHDLIKFYSYGRLVWLWNHLLISDATVIPIMNYVCSCTWCEISLDIYILCSL